MKFLLMSLFTISIFFVHATSVDTVLIFSRAMNKIKKCVVIKPDSYFRKKLPTVYLLHGYAGDFSNWIVKVPQLKNYVDEFQLLIVCPDGDYSSWYINSPIDANHNWAYWSNANSISIAFFQKLF